MKILICGHARHGKDTFCEMLGFSWTSSSAAALDLAVWPKFSSEYASKEACFADRVDRRREWFALISEYNTPDKARLTREILSSHDVYCGMRSLAEFEATVDLFNLTIWVDASTRLPPEPSASNELDASMFDVTVDNNGTLESLENAADFTRAIVCALGNKLATLFAG